MQILLESLAANIGWTIIGACVLFMSAAKTLIVLVSLVAQERSRREIAAYVASGSITPEQGERLIRADVSTESSRAI